MNTEKKTIFVEATKESVEAALNQIKKFAEEEGYQIKGDLKMPSNWVGMTKKVDFSSKTQEKVCRKYLTLLQDKVTMRIANKFLHFLFKKTYKMDSAPHIEYSEKELKIKATRAAWKKAAAEAEKLRLAYREEKGDFYKVQLKKVA